MEGVQGKHREKKYMTYEKFIEFIEIFIETVLMFTRTAFHLHAHCITFRAYRISVHGMRKKIYEIYEIYE